MSTETQSISRSKPPDDPPNKQNPWATLRKLWKEANPSVKKSLADEQVASFWRKNKDDKKIIDMKLAELKMKIMNRRNPIRLAFQRQIAGVTADRIIIPDMSVPIRSEQVDDYNPQPDSETETEVSTDGGNEISDKVVLSEKKPTPAQDHLRQELSDVNAKIASLVQVKTIGIHFTGEMSCSLKDLMKQKVQLEKNLKKLVLNQKASQNLRVKRKRRLEELKTECPEIVEKLNKAIPKDTPGRPSVEVNQDGLSKAILDIVSRNCTADEKRRCETLRYSMKIKDLLHELKKMNFIISRQGLSLRFKPRNKTSKWGRRHVSTVNVKLAKATNTHQKKHLDSHFAAATIRFLNDLADLYGEDIVNVISVDDKARVPLGIPAASKQGPILMRMDYEVRLPDHDWVVGTRHKFIPSVTAGLCFQDGRLSYSGPTLISIRSGKHDSSTAETHSRDLDRMFSLPQFDYFTKNNGELKPILIIFVDGGPDENPRYPKTLVQAIKHFNHYQLDALFVATHAPYQSARNPVERRMAPLSLDLCGIILPHEHFGSHLNSSGKTIDDNLELKIFDKAGHALANLWNNKMIDGHKVVAEYIHPPVQTGCLLESSSCTDLQGTDTENFETIENFEDSEDEDMVTNLPPRTEIHKSSEGVTEKWKSIHVRQSQYMLQIIKCSDARCCRSMKTNLKRFLPEGFLPAPVLYQRASSGPAISEDSKGKFFDLLSRIALNFLKIKNAPSPLPFDWFCPSISASVSSKCCTWCGIYFPTKTALQAHRSVHDQPKSNHGRSNVEEDCNIEFVVEMCDAVDSNTGAITIIDNMDLWLAPAFVEVE